MGRWYWLGCVLLALVHCAEPLPPKEPRRESAVATEPQREASPREQPSPEPSRSEPSPELAPVDGSREPTPEEPGEGASESRGPEPDATRPPSLQGALAQAIGKGQKPQLTAQGSTLKLQTTGGNFAFKSDDGGFYGRKQEGLFDIGIELLAAPTGNQAWSKAGLMVRSSLDADAVALFLGLNGRGELLVLRRAAKGADAWQERIWHEKPPRCLRLRRDAGPSQGSFVLHLFASVEAGCGSWKYLGSSHLALGPSVQLGVALAGYGPGATVGLELSDIQQWDPLKTPGPPISKAPRQGTVLAYGYTGLRAWTTDGASWSKALYDPGASKPGDNSLNIRHLIYSPRLGTQGAYVGVGGGTALSPSSFSRRVLLSTDAGRSWTTPLSNRKQWLGGVADGNGWLVAVGGTSTVLRSKDGRSWEEKAKVSNRHLRSVRFYDGAFYARGDKELYARSTTNGERWEMLKAQDFPEFLFAARIPIQEPVDASMTRLKDAWLRIAGGVIEYSPHFGAKTWSKVGKSARGNGLIFALGLFFSRSWPEKIYTAPRPDAFKTAVSAFLSKGAVNGLVFFPKTR